MTVSFLEMDDKERMFSFVGDDGVNIHVAIDRLLKWVNERKSKLTVYQVPVHPPLAKKFVLEGSVTKERVRELLRRPRHITPVVQYKPKFEPIIFGKDTIGREDSVDMYLLDGRHRYVAAVIEGHIVIEAYILEPKRWRAFKVTDVPNISKGILAQIPVRSQ